MSVSIGRILSLAAMAAFAGTGLLQAEQASFHLPVAAHWGQTVLQPGDYKIFLPVPSVGARELRVEHAGQSMLEIPLITSVRESSNSSYLKLLAVNGDYFVREISSGPTGKTFTFWVPKADHRQQMAKNGDQSVTVTVN